MELARREFVKERYFKSVFFSRVNSAIGHEPNRGITEVEIPAAELSGGKEADGSRQARLLARHKRKKQQKQLEVGKNWLKPVVHKDDICAIIKAP